jgi:hypothetical protein
MMDDAQLARFVDELDDLTQEERDATLDALTVDDKKKLLPYLEQDAQRIGGQLEQTRHDITLHVRTLALLGLTGDRSLADLLKRKVEGDGMKIGNAEQMIETLIGPDAPWKARL